MTKNTFVPFLDEEDSITRAFHQVSDCECENHVSHSHFYFEDQQEFF